MVDMGFDLGQLTAVLERTDFAVGPALTLLLNGLDEQRTRTDRQQSERFRRHGRQTIATARGDALVGDAAFSQYTQRASDVLGLVVSVWDAAT